MFRTKGPVKTITPPFSSLTISVPLPLNSICLFVTSCKGKLLVIDIVLSYLSIILVSANWRKLIFTSKYHPWKSRALGLLPDTHNCGLRMCPECRERFPRHRLQRKPLVSDPRMHYGTWVKHVPWCMSGSLTCSGEENVPGMARNFAYLVRGPWYSLCSVVELYFNHFQ